MKKVNVVVLSATDSSSTSVMSTSQIDANQLFNASFQILFDGTTSAGTFSLQASNDIDNVQYSSSAGFTVTNWSDIPGSTVAVTAGVSEILPLANMGYRWIRGVYTGNASGDLVTIQFYGITF